MSESTDKRPYDEMFVSPAAYVAPVAHVLASEGMLVQGLAKIPKPFAPQNPAYHHTFVTRFTSASWITVLKYLGVAACGFLIGDSWDNIKAFYYDKDKTAGKYCGLVKDSVRMVTGVAMFLAFLVLMGVLHAKAYVAIGWKIQLLSIGLNALYHFGYAAYHVVLAIVSLYKFWAEGDEKFLEAAKEHAWKAVKHIVLLAVNVVLMVMIVGFFFPTDKLVDKFIIALKQSNFFKILSLTNQIGVLIMQKSKLLEIAVITSVVAAAIAVANIIVSRRKDWWEQAGLFEGDAFGYLSNRVSSKFGAMKEVLNEMKGKCYLIPLIPFAVLFMVVFEAISVATKLPRFIMMSALYDANEIRKSPREKLRKELVTPFHTYHDAFFKDTSRSRQFVGGLLAIPTVILIGLYKLAKVVLTGAAALLLTAGAGVGQAKEALESHIVGDSFETLTI